MTRKFLTAAILILSAVPFTLAQTAASAPIPSASTAMPMKIGGDVLPPVLTHLKDPKFPREQRMGTTAVVTVGLVVDARGKPTGIHIVKSSNSAFDKNAMKAVEKYQFNPATLRGKAVPVQLNVEINFHVVDHMPPGGNPPPTHSVIPVSPQQQQPISKLPAFPSKSTN